VLPRPFLFWRTFYGSVHLRQRLLQHTDGCQLYVGGMRWIAVSQLFNTSWRIFAANGDHWRRNNYLPRHVDNTQKVRGGGGTRRFLGLVY